MAVLRRGGEDVLGVAATTATAGIIVGVVTLTGLGLKLAGVIVTLAGGTLALTVIYSAIAVWMLGLAVPVTASYIIAAVMVAPALVQSGVPDFAAHMFIFYYAVLSEVSPPTALSPFAAAALTGGNPFKTMLLTWKYTLPAFVVPLVFTLRPEGAGILLRGPIENVVLATATAAAGIAALAGAFGGWLLGPVSRLSQAFLVVSGASFLYGGPGGAAAGGALLVLVLILQSFRYGKGENGRQGSLNLAATAVCSEASRAGKGRNLDVAKIDPDEKWQVPVFVPSRPGEEMMMGTTTAARVENQKGFTLIDMLFVIALVGVLSTLAIPGLMRARGAAQSSSALGTIRVVNSAQLSFAITCGLGFYSPEFPDARSETARWEGSVSARRNWRRV